MRASVNVGLNVALAVGVGAALIGGLVLLFADSRSPKGVIISTPERAPAQTPGAPLETPTPSAIAVYVSGAVGEPGVYELASDARANDALTAAGGASPDADLERVNLAKRLSDGEHIRVPRRGDPTAIDAVPNGLPPTYARPDSGGAPSPKPAGKIDVNSAQADSLETLPGIGPARARAIIEHRQANGPFADVDALMEVRGIGEGILESIRDLIEAR